MTSPEQQPLSRPGAIALARTLIAELVAAGVRDVVLSPGSRSAPLAYALSDAHDAGWLRLVVRLDERGAGFVALGLTRAGDAPRPVAVVTTSGTAVANLHPAVLEASHAGDPLVVVTADRPHEWRDTGANQATVQPGIFGTAPRWQADLPAGFAPAAVRGVVTRAVAAATGALTLDPGPVHLNVALAEPLVPDVALAEPLYPDLARSRSSGPLARAEEPNSPDWVGAGLPRPVVVEPNAPNAVDLPAGRRTILIVGDRAGARWHAAGRQAGWPVLAEPTSGARFPGVIRHYRDLLEAGLGDDAERIVVTGHPTLSRPVARLLARGDVEIVVVGNQRWTDVAGVAARIVGDLAVPDAEPSDTAWLDHWRAADQALHGVVEERGLLSGAERVASAVWDAQVPTLVLGSSNAVRAVDGVAGGRDDGARVVGHRGLGGIDGTIGTATGLALGTGAPVRTMLGDLTFLHDAMSLLRGSRENEVDLQVVVLNDRGGAIFETLEHGEISHRSVSARHTFERIFLTPQHADIGLIAGGLDASHTAVDLTEPGALERLASLLAEPIRGRSIVEVVLGREDLAGVVRRRVAAAREIRRTLG
ncbi:MAG TPA: 2-succinyl-5-enolpyruvyl-6-hydroxy-3-cyclohexene-1-carboxylic-acid synthase [Actinomycetaceae bacterium]|nr:2-succinyl-5-enolpyruvyl-6-hydroxy-3-cyclohexene-1-carboxylic-acid synthase [Actinomycetaceae bacterium]